MCSMWDGWYDQDEEKPPSLKAPLKDTDAYEIISLDLDAFTEDFVDVGLDTLIKRGDDARQERPNGRGPV